MTKRKTKKKNINNKTALPRAPTAPGSWPRSGRRTTGRPTLCWARRRGRRSGEKSSLFVCLGGRRRSCFSSFFLSLEDDNRRRKEEKATTALFLSRKREKKKERAQRGRKKRAPPARTRKPEENLSHQKRLATTSFLSSFPKTKKKPKMKNRARLPRVAVAWIRNYLAELALYFGVGGKEEEGGG